MERDIPEDPYARTTYDGNTVNWRTRAMLEVVALRLYGDPDILTVHQGSYNAGGVSASAGTHDGGGAVDLSANDWRRKVKALRQVGFAAWFRPTIPGLWNEHIHAIAIGDKDLSSGAAAQVTAYRNHKDGLAGNEDDHFPFHPDGVHFNYQAWRNRQLNPKDWFDMADREDLREVVDAALAPVKQAIRDMRVATFERDQDFLALLNSIEDGSATKAQVTRVRKAIVERIDAHSRETG